MSTERKCVLQFESSSGARWRKVIGWATEERAEQERADAQAGFAQRGRADVSCTLVWGKRARIKPQPTLPGMD